MNFMGIDVGTTSVKVGVYDERLTPLASRSIDYTLNSHGDVVDPGLHWLGLPCPQKGDPHPGAGWRRAAVRAEILLAAGAVQFLPGSAERRGKHHNDGHALADPAAELPLGIPGEKDNLSLLQFSYAFYSP